MITCRCSKYVISIFRNRLLLNSYKTCSSDAFSLKKHLDSVTNDSELSKYEEFTPTELSNLVQKNKLDWTEEFGTLADKKIQLIEDEEDDQPYVRLSKINRKHFPDYYAKKIINLGKKNMIFEAIEVLETEMLITDRVMPNEFVFTALIGVLGRVGYTKKAFQLFNKMKKFGIIPVSHTYTSLFNCCANSPDKKEGLELLFKLRNLIDDKEIQMNQITFQAMLKAYAQLGDLTGAFARIDEAVKLKIKLNENVYSFLLMACISDKQNGFNLALRVWQMILTSKVNVNLYHINLILKAARNCDVGNIQQINDLFNSITDESVNKIKTKLLIKDILPNNFSSNNILTINSNLDEVEVEVKKITESKSPVQSQLHGALSKIDIKAEKKETDIKYTSLDFSQLPAVENKRKSKRINESLISKEYNISELVSQSLKINADKKISSKTLSHVKSTINTSNIKPDINIKSLPINTSSFSPPPFQNAIDVSPQIPDINLLLPTKVPKVKGINLPLQISDKLSLMGGLKGFISLLNTLKIEPNLKTVSLLLDLLSIDGTAGKEDENFLFEYIQDKNIKLDATFYNLLIKKRNLRRDFEGAKKVVTLMAEKGIEPDIRTFGCLAMGCTKKPDAFQLIADMQKLSMVPNIEICEILLSRSRQDFDYKLDIFKKMKELQIRPNRSFLQKIDSQVMEARIIVSRIEQNKEVKPMFLTSKFQDGYRRFVLNYKDWLQGMQLEPKVHPWDPYKQPTLDHAANTFNDDNKYNNND